MNCEQVAPYLPGLAGGELKAETARWVDSHLAGCASCRTEAGRHRAIASALGELSRREFEPPAFLVEAVMDRVHAERRRRYVPLSPVLPAELVRVVQDNRDAIVSAAGAALVAIGAAYALWRAVRSIRPSTQPARS